MIELFFILRDVILPVFILISIGFIIQRKLELDIQTLARLNIYFLVPGFIFVNLYQAEFSAALFLRLSIFFIIFILILFVLATLIARIMKLDDGRKVVFTNSVIFYNSGNYGVSVNDLVFKSDPLAMSIQVIVLMFQNIFTFSYGIFSLQSMQIGKLKAALSYFKMPVLYAMLAGILFNVFNLPIPNFVWVPASYIANAMIAMALLTLGAQVSQIKFITGLRTVYISSALRLLAGPSVALVIILLLQIDGIIAQALLISSAMPTSVNSAVIAQEYRNHPNFAAQIVLFSTVFSTLTVTLVIYLARLIF